MLRIHSPTKGQFIKHNKADALQMKTQLKRWCLSFAIQETGGNRKYLSKMAYSKEIFPQSFWNLAMYRASENRLWKIEAFDKREKYVIYRDCHEKRWIHTVKRNFDLAFIQFIFLILLIFFQIFLTNSFPCCVLNKICIWKRHRACAFIELKHSRVD